MWYEREFTNFDENLRYVYDDLNVPESWDYRTQGEAFQKWIDCSWHNDSCPRFSFIVGAPYDENMNLDLFVDYFDPQMSENPESRADGSFKRFNLYNEQACRIIFETDDWKEMRFFIKGFIDALTTACVALAETDIPRVMLYKAQLRPITPVYMKVHNKYTMARDNYEADALKYASAVADSLVFVEKF
jgi:hypothetical protein